MPERARSAAEDVGATYGFPANYDVCEAAAGGGQNGHVDYCRDYGPCSTGEGDCDSTSECQSGLECRRNVGTTYGFPANYDVCEAAAGGGQNGHVDYCRDYGPCSTGEGDCDSTSECQSGLECRRNVGTTYGFPAELRCVRVAQWGDEKGAAWGASPGCLTKRSFYDTPARWEEQGRRTETGICVLCTRLGISMYHILNEAEEKWDSVTSAGRSAMPG